MKDEDVARIEQPICEPLEARHQENLKRQKGAERQQQIELEQKHQKTEHENKLRRYEQEFSRAVQAEYPLNQFVVDALKAFQQQLGLQDGDVARIEQSVREPVEAKYREKLKQQEQTEQQRKKELEDSRRAEQQKPTQETERRRHEEEKAEHENKLRRYEETFCTLGLQHSDGKATQNQYVRSYLKDLQHQLGLKDTEVVQIEESAVRRRSAAQALFNKASAMLEGFDINRDECIALLQRAIEIDPSFTEVYLKLVSARSSEDQK